MKDRFLISNGTRFHYVDWGGDGPDLLLVHPTGFVANVWQPLAEGLRGRFHTLALDTPGHGDTGKPEGEYGLRRLVVDLGAFLDAAALRNPIGIGHSAGATSLAAVEANRPGSFRALVLIDPVLEYRAGLRPHTIENDPLAASALKRRAIWPSRREVFDSYRARPPFQSWDEGPLRQYVEHGFADRADGAIELKCAPATESTMYLRGAHELAAGDLIPQVRCPVLLLRGAESAVFTAEKAAKTAALLSDCRLAIIPGGHFAPFEQTRRTEEEIQRFLAESEPDGKPSRPADRRPGADALKGID